MALLSLPRSVSLKTKPMRFIFYIMLVLVATASVAGVAAGAPVDTGLEATNETNQSDDAARCTETINENTQICDARLDGSDVVIEIKTAGQQRIVVTEAFRKGSGVLQQRTVMLSEGVNEVRLTVTVDGGSEGVTIAAGDVLYQKEVIGDRSMFTGPWSSSDSQAAAIGAGVSVALLILLMVFRAAVGGTQDPERIA